MTKPENMHDRIDLQNAEFDAADAFAKALKAHNSCAVVDDDYPATRHAYEAAVVNLLRAMKDNGRFAPNNRLGVYVDPVHTGLLAEIAEEVARATAKFPTWPTDPLHAVGVVNEEAGELSKAVLQEVYEPIKNPSGAVRREAIQVGAMAVRFLMSIDTYQWVGGKQHEQR